MPENGTWPYRFEVVPLSKLFVDEAYQRPLTNFVKRIETKFNPALVGTLVVSERPRDKYAIVDGQTRKVAIERKGFTDRVPCLVYSGLTQADEAGLFADLQTERRGMVAATRFRAQVIAKDPHAVRTEQICNEEGFTIGLNIQDGYEIQAIGAIERLYRGDKGATYSWEPHEVLLRRVLQIVKTAWPDMPEGAKAGAMLRGIGYWLMRDHWDADDVKLTNALGRVTPSEMMRRADQLREGRGAGGGSPQYLAEAIDAVYKRSR